MNNHPIIEELAWQDFKAAIVRWFFYGIVFVLACLFVKWLF